MAFKVNHRITHVQSYVEPNDESWLYSKINRELDIVSGRSALAEGETELPWATEDEHPFRQYMSGSSRLDLSTVSAYLNPDVPPAIFQVRRPGLDQWGLIRDALDRGRHFKARTHAIAFCLVSIEGLVIPGMMNKSGSAVDLRREDPADPLSEDVLEDLFAALDSTRFDALGLACLNNASGLRPNEKKPFGSGRGGRR